MWHCEQKPSSSEPEWAVRCWPPATSKVAEQSRLAKGLRLAFGVPSGGLGVSQSPAVEVSRATSRKAPRQPGSRHELDIIEPFHSLKMRPWQVAHLAGLCCSCQ